MGARFRLAVAALAIPWLIAACQNSAPPAVEQEAPPTVARPLVEGDLAPDFSLPGTDGKQYHLASYRGRQAVVLAWFAKAFTEG